jgi:hypothetical protein
MTIEVCELRSAELDEETNLPKVRAVSRITDDPDDVEEFGEITSMQCLGVTCKPWPSSDAGHAEGVVARNAGNSEGVIIGGHDKRCAQVYGKLGDGDTDLHSTDPNASAQVMCKANRQVVMMTKDTHGDNMNAALDGKNDKVQIAAFGGLIEMTPERISLVCPSGEASIIIEGSTIMLAGNVTFGVAPVLNLAGGTVANITAVPPVLVPIGGVYGQP